MRSKLALSLFCIAGIASAAPSEWTIDSDHSAAQFTVRHLAVSNVRGEFGNVRGRIVFDEASPSKTTIEATIDATTINTRVAGRDDDLKGPGFFDVAKYPTITFRSTSVLPAGPNAFEVSGDLTIHGVTKPVVLHVESPAAVKNAHGVERRGAEATTKVSRKAFGVSADAGIVGDEVQVTIDLEAVRRPE